MNNRQLLYLVDAVGGTATEAMVIPQLGAISDFVADGAYLAERITLLTTEIWTAGTASLFTRKNGTQGASALAALSTDMQWQIDIDLDPNNAEHQLTRGQRFGLDIVTAGWTPTSADIIAILSLSKLT